MEIYEANRIRKFPEEELPPKEWWYYAYERALKTLKDRKIRARAGSPYETKQELAHAITGWNWWHNMLPETRQFIIDTVRAQRAEGEGGVVTSKGRIPDSTVKKKLGAAAKRVLEKAKPSKKEIKEARRMPEISRTAMARRKVAANMRTPDFMEIGYASNPLNRMEVSKLFKEADKAEEYGDWAASEGHPVEAIGWYQQAYRICFIVRNYIDRGMSEERRIPVAAGWPETTETEYPAEHLVNLAEEKMRAITLKIKAQLPAVAPVRSLPYHRTPEMRKYTGYFGEQLPGFEPFEMNPSLMMMMGNPVKLKNTRGKKNSGKKTARRKRNPATATKKDAEAVKRTRKYKEAVKKYKQFHKGANPVELIPVNVPDGSIADGTVLVGLGTTPEAIYHVPKHSGKQSKIPFKHDYEGTVIKCTDAKGKTIIDLPVGRKKFKVTDWIHG